MAAGFDSHGDPCEGCVDENPPPGSPEEALCHAAFFAVLLLLYSTDLIRRVSVIHSVGTLASKALVAETPLKLRDE